MKTSAAPHGISFFERINPFSPYNRLKKAFSILSQQDGSGAFIVLLHDLRSIDFGGYVFPIEESAYKALLASAVGRQADNLSRKDLNKLHKDFGMTLFEEFYRLCESATKNLDDVQMLVPSVTRVAERLLAQEHYDDFMELRHRVRRSETLADVFTPMIEPLGRQLLAKDFLTDFIYLQLVVTDHPAQSQACEKASEGYTFVTLPGACVGAYDAPRFSHGAEIAVRADSAGRLPVLCVPDSDFDGPKAIGVSALCDHWALTQSVQHEAYISSLDTILRTIADERPDMARSARKAIRELQNNGPL